MRNLGYGTISVTGIPSGSAIINAYLMWDVLDNTDSPALAVGAFNGQAISGTEIATGASPCWPPSANFSFDANVTAQVGGNGTYQLSGFASGVTNGQDPWTGGGSPAPAIEGASLVVVYENPNSPITDVQLLAGASETSGSVLSQTFPGLVAFGANAQTTFIVADGQGAGSQALINGAVIPNSEFMGADPQAVPNYSQGNLWDTSTFNVSPYLLLGPIATQLSIQGSGDCLVWVGQVLATTPQPPVNYSALGDSYSSGEGTGPLYLGAGQSGSVLASDTSSDQCHRSPKAYSEDLAAANGWNLSFYACSGAHTGNILVHRQNGEPPQIKDLNSSTNLVTLTIGGNNVGFKSVIMGCIEQTVEANLENEVTLGFVGADPSCVDNTNFVQNEDRVIANTEKALLTTFQAIKLRVPKASIIVLDYPQLFPTQTAGQGCTQLIPYLTGADQSQLNGFAQLLDLFEHQAAYDAGVNFVDVQSAFQGHGVCGSAGAYINGITGTFVGSFHPNAAGQNQYALSTSNYITASNQAGFPETPQLLPQNPPPGIDPPGRPAPVIPAADLALIGQIPTQSHGSLSVTSLATDFNASCEGQFQAGQIVQLSGGGYAPGARVPIDLSSPGHGFAFKTRIATVVADTSGNINTAVRIPLGTSGFAVTGQTDNVAFLDAPGTSATAPQTRLTDTGALGIVKAGNQCGTVDPLGFAGFDSPVSNPPTMNTVISGLPVPVRFTIPGITASLDEVVAAGSPQSTPVSCTTLAPTGTPTPTDPPLTGLAGYLRPDDGIYLYPWFTSASWTGCRELTVTLADGTVHNAYFKFVQLW